MYFTIHLDKHIKRNVLKELDSLEQEFIASILNLLAG